MTPDIRRLLIARTRANTRPWNVTMFRDAVGISRGKNWLSFQWSTTTSRAIDIIRRNGVNQPRTGLHRTS